MGVRERAREALAGRTVAITGASGGIGRATALILAPLAGRLVLLGRDGDRLAAVVAECRRAGGRAEAVVADLRDHAAAGAAGKSLAADGVEVLVANAGLSINRRVLAYADRFDTLERSAGVNYLGAVALALPVLGAMAERESGQLIGVTTVQAAMPLPGWSAYCSSKAAFDIWLRCAAPELREAGIATTIVRFPLVDTPMIRPTYPRTPRYALSPDGAAGWIVQAIADRPAVVAPGWARAAEVLVAAFPTTAARLMGRVASRVTGGR